MKRPQIPSLGLRGEALVLLPASLLVLIALSAFTLFAYRNAIERLIEERLRSARAAVSDLARASAVTGSANPPELQRLLSQAPGVRSLVVVDQDGLSIAEAGDAGPQQSFASLGGPPSAPLAIGPSQATGGRIVAYAPIASNAGSPSERRDQALWVRIELDASTLFSHSRSLPLLTTVVVSIDAALMVLLLLFLRHWLAPFDSLMERGPAPWFQQKGSSAGMRSISSFRPSNQALAAMAGSEGASAASDESVEAAIQTLQHTLSPSIESGLLDAGSKRKRARLEPCWESNPRAGGAGRRNASWRAPHPPTRGCSLYSNSN